MKYDKYGNPIEEEQSNIPVRQEQPQQQTNNNYATHYSVRDGVMTGSNANGIVSQNKVGVDPDVNYQQESNQAMSQGNWAEASKNAQYHNQKIDQYGLSQPYNYALAGYKEQNPTWANPYQSTIDSLASNTVNRQPFTYNPDTDPAYQAYLKMANREAERQTLDTLGKVSGLTGGMPSSYAVSAANQAGAYERSKATDRIPELYQIARNMYDQDIQNNRNDVNMYRTLGIDDASTFADNYNRQYTINRDAVGDYLEQRREARGEANDIINSGGTLSDEQIAATGWNYDDVRTREDAYAKNMNKATALNAMKTALDNGVMPDDATLENAGYIAYKPIIKAVYDKYNKKEQAEEKANELEYALKLVNLGLFDELQRVTGISDADIRELRREYMMQYE